MSTINTHKHNGNFKPLVQSYSPEQKQMAEIIKKDKESGNMKAAREERKQLRSTFTQQQRGLSDQAREKSGMPLIDWQPGSGQYMESGRTSGSPSTTSSPLNYSA